MSRPDFIVPPPGLIPDAAAPHPAGGATANERTVRVPAADPPGPAPTPMPVPRPSALPSGPPRPAAPAWRLRGAGGVDVRVDRGTVLGRDPLVDPASGHAAVALADPARSVSKTHALVQVVAGRLVVTDLGSTNGVRIWPLGDGPADIPPNVPTEVPDGATLLLGDLGLQAERVPGDTVVA